jgi:plastocyanin
MTVAQVLSRPRAHARVLLPALLLALGGVATVLAGLAAGAVPAPAPREVVLEARDMAFFAPGDPTPNPTLELARGERVRLVLRNADPGMTHDFVAPGLAVATPLLRDAGESTAVVFRAPAEPGEHGYSCTPHAAMMRGHILVR